MITLAQIHERLARAIKENAPNQSVVAKRIGVSPSQISSYVNGRKFPALDTFANLCAALDVDANYILCLTDLG